MYQTNNKPELFLPKQIVLDKFEKTNVYNEQYDFEGSTVFTKVIPEINVNAKAYKDCVRMDNKGTQCYKKEFGGGA